VGDERRSGACLNGGALSGHEPPPQRQRADLFSPSTIHRSCPRCACWPAFSKKSRHRVSKTHCPRSGRSFCFPMGASNGKNTGGWRVSTPALHPHRLCAVVAACRGWKNGRTGGPCERDHATTRGQRPLVFPTPSHRTPRLHGQDRRHPGLARRHLPADRVPAVDRAAPPAGRVKDCTTVCTIITFLAVVPPRSVFYFVRLFLLMPLRQRAFEKPGQAVQKSGA
jgi:hypothetical protein